MPVSSPRLKVIRRLGVQLPGLTRKSADRRPQPPGAHGHNPRRRRPTDFRLRLEEKQKVRLNYGVTERQMLRYMTRARVLPGPTGTNLLTLLERRLDNVVFRLGLAPTIPAARQLVSHGHVAVNGRRVDRPSFEVSVGDEISLSPRAVERASPGLPAKAEPVLRLPGFLALVPEDRAGRMVAPPSRSDVPFPVDEALIVEYYAR